MSDVTITGSVQGYAASVGSDGSLQTQVANSVDTQPAACTVYKSVVTVGTSSGQLVAARSGRRGIWIQNGANPIHLKFAAATANAGDWLVAANGELRSETFPYEGEIRAIAEGASSSVLVLEFAP